MKYIFRLFMLLVLIATVGNIIKATPDWVWWLLKAALLAWFGLMALALIVLVVETVRERNRPPARDDSDKAPPSERQ